MKRATGLLGILFVVTLWGCAPALIGAGVAGGYKVGSDERSVGQIWDDSTISAHVLAALVDSETVKARRIDVDTVQQVVTLTGLVGTEAEAQAAVEIARKVEHVKDVKSYLQVGDRTMGQALDDKVIGSKIKARLITERDIRSLNIDVDVVRRVVTLTGVVKSDDQKKRAIDIARTTLGVKEVIDNLTVHREQEETAKP